MTRFSAGRWALAALLAGAGCTKNSTAPAPKAQEPDSVALVPPAERSPHFAAVNRHLELGGTLYGYADVDGDALKLAAALHNLAENVSTGQPAVVAAVMQQDYAKLFADLGLTDIKAVGFSSVPAATGGFRNAAFLYTPAGRHGLLAVLGGAPGPFIHTKLAPADTDLYGEADLDLNAVYTTVKTVVARVAGDSVANLMEARLREAGRPAGLSVLELIQNFKGRTVVVLRLDPEKNITVPAGQPLTVPDFSLLVRIDGIGPALAGALAKLPNVEPSQVGTMQLFELKTPLLIPSLHPTLAVEGAALYVATTRAFLLECVQRQSGLDQNPEFQRALSAVGTEGNGLAYCSPRLFSRLRQLDQLNPNAAPPLKRSLAMMAAQMPVAKEPLVSVRTNLPDGVLVRSHWNRSLKQDVVMAAVYNPVTVGVLAAVAIPAFQKVRQASQEKIVLNNLRMLGAAADRFYLERGVENATYDDLVGPDKGIKQLVTVMGENYRQLRFRQGVPLRMRLPDGRVIQYPPPAQR